MIDYLRNPSKFMPMGSVLELSDFAPRTSVFSRLYSDYDHDWYVALRYDVRVRRRLSYYEEDEIPPVLRF